jgi:hypothetical protein
MLAWMSETGTGNIQDLRQRLTWLARTADLNPDRYQAGRWVRDIASLGHAEADWESGRWAITPSSGVLLPASGGTVVLAGRRTPDLLERIHDHPSLSVQTILPAKNQGGDLPSPPRLYLQADSIGELAEALDEVRVRYVGIASRHIADLLPPLSLGAPAAPPAWKTPVEHLVYSGDKGVRWFSGWPTGDGLCRLSIHGRDQYLYRQGSEWLHTDMARGILWALAEQRHGVVRWRVERQVGDETIGTVFVDQGAPFPPLHARALVLCSGIPTQLGHTARTVIYKNVPRSTAEVVARSIRQHLSIVS